MATIDEHDMPTLVDHARYCSRCGHVAGDGPFCPGCGSPIEAQVPPLLCQPLENSRIWRGGAGEVGSDRAFHGPSLSG